MLSNAKCVIKTHFKEQLCRRYHSRGLSDYDLTRVGPDRLPLPIFHALYPYALACLYGADMRKKRIVIRSACDDTSAHFSVHRREYLPAPLLAVKNLLLSLLGKLGLCIEFLTCDVFMVCERATGAWSDLMQYSPYKLNLRDKTRLCPAAFAILFPMIFLHRSRVRNLRFHCPDSEGIIYDILDVSNTDAAMPEDVCSFDWGPENVCAEGLCPALAYTLAPYFISIGLGASFWETGIRIQCLAVEGVCLRVHEKREYVECRVKKLKGPCACGYTVGAVIRFKKNRLSAQFEERYHSFVKTLCERRLVAPQYAVETVSSVQCEDYEW